MGTHRNVQETEQGETPVQGARPWLRNTEDLSVGRAGQGGWRGPEGLGMAEAEGGGREGTREKAAKGTELCKVPKGLLDNEVLSA